MLKAKRLNFLTVLTITVVLLLPSLPASSSPNNNPTPPPVQPRQISENQMPNYFLKHSVVPVFHDDAESSHFLIMLTSLAGRVNGPSLPFWGTLVVAEGAGADGYYWIFVKADKVANINATVVSLIISKIDDASILIGWLQDVPVKFAQATGQSDFKAGRSDQWRPVIGGIKVTDKYYIFCGGYALVTVPSTLGFSAKIGGTQGYVVAGHVGADCSGNRQIVPVNAQFYQPDDPNSAGTVSVAPGQDSYADAAFVTFSNVAPQVYAGGIGMSYNFYQDPALGNTVYMSGWISDLQSGTVQFVNVDEWVPGIYTTLHKQALANYHAQNGDSGAPVYIEVSGYGRGPVGTESGASITQAGLERFSPVSGIQTQLGAVPITIYG
ncbi:MAG: S1 family peptidase [Nitrososphaerales archaeon]|nr:S1 family peptidase [Nitrososphaerales archaeon]